MVRRVALFVNRFPAASETFVADQVQALLDGGIQVHVWSRRPRDPARFPAHPGLRLRPWPESPLRRGIARLRLGPSASLRVRRIQAEQARDRDLAVRAGMLRGSPRYDLILAHFGTQGLDAHTFRRLGVLRGPLAVIFHGFDVSRFVEDQGEDVYRDLLAHAERALPISDRWRRRLIELGADPDRTQVHRMGVRTDQIGYRPAAWSAGEPLKVLSVARLVEKKGLHVAMPAMGALARDVESLEWNIIGGGPERDRLEALAERHRVPVNFLGSQSRDVVASHLQTSHILLAPSVTSAAGDREGIPVAIMEGMAQGLLVVSTRHSGIPELVSEDAGLLAEEGDPDSLLRCLRNAAGNPHRWPSMLDSARRKVETEFDQGWWNQRLLALVEEMTHESG